MNTERNLNKRKLSSILMTIALISIGFYGNEATARSFKKITTTRKMDIVSTAIKAGNFNTLVTAVKAADLVDTLKGPGLSLSLLLPTRPSVSYRHKHLITS